MAELDENRLSPETDPAAVFQAENTVPDPAELPAQDDQPAAEKESAPDKTDTDPVPTTAENDSSPIDALSGISLASSLCDCVLSAVGPEYFHGGVRPDNITVLEDIVYLGGTLKHNVGGFTPQELEYMAPELFWDGIRCPAGDVYSIGLILYSIYNYGRLPFWPSAGAVTPNARASALQKRMSDEIIAPPASADRELSDVILRALSFRTEERWNNVSELKNALGACDVSASSADITLAMSGLLNRTTSAVAASGKQTAAEKSKTYDDEGELPVNPRKPRRRKNLSWLWVLLFAAVIVAAVLLIFGGAKEAPTPPAEQVTVTTPTPTTAPTSTPSPTPESTATPEPTKKPEGPQFIVYKENVSWGEAVKRCEDLGGRLAMPVNAEEFEEIARLCDGADIGYAWLGASRREDGNWIMTNGEIATYFFWAEGEPSYVDAGDNVEEDYMLIWKIDDTWVGNDSRENPLDDFFFTYGDNIGFVCQMW